MGLCKCPKRSVTNQFCFEHRVNVCEHCMITSHPKCVVQSYLQWLKDSDYDAACALCRTALEVGDCVRLTCYHVFHWDCLNGRASALPANTAPSGHTCPVCSAHVFPPANLISPVADVLRSRLGQVNWGRAELGLPLLAGLQPSSVGSAAGSSTKRGHVDGGNSGSSIGRQQTSSPIYTHQKTIANVSGSSNSSGSVGGASSSHVGDGAPATVLNMDAYEGSSRRALLPRVAPIGATSDSDDNKYKKRSPAEMFRRWSRRFYSPSSRPPWRRTWCLVLAGFVAFFFFVYLMALLGRRNVLDDDADAIQSHM